MCKTISFYIPGTPVAKGRPRFSYRSRHAYTPRKTIDFEGRVRSIAKCEMLSKGEKDPFTGPVFITIDFYMPRPKHHTKTQRAIRYCITRPDLDNMEKAIMDALNGIVYKDDNQICQKQAAKKYADNGTVVGTYITVTCS